ncbi:MAG: calcium-binding protein, partial [Alphaproteobacteria bacterium]|nr:calcium-binding protein [Alphaproteobacteria bacterium]
DGGSHDDRLAGGAGDEVIEVGTGDDRLAGGAGDVVLEGGEGDDVLAGGVGDDMLEGGDGDDVLIGGVGDDVLTGGKGEDVLVGGAGDDVLVGDAKDEMYGGAGDDIFEIGAKDFRGGAEIDGGSGEDTLLITSGKDVAIDLGHGKYDDAIEEIDNIEAIDLAGAEGDVHLALDASDVIKLTDDDHELTIFRGEGDVVDLKETDGMEATASDPGAELDGFTTYTYFDEAGAILAKVHIQNDDPSITGGA